MSDYLHDWIQHTQPNVHGGEDFFGADGTRLGYSTPSVDGGHDLYDAHGHQLLHVRGNVHGGHDVADHLGRHLAHGFASVNGGEDVYASDGARIGHVHAGDGILTFQGAHGNFETWHANVFGGMSADPLSNMRSIQFPPFGM